MHSERIVTGGQPLTTATNVLLMLHGRGGSAQDTLSLAQYLDVADFALLAPQAPGHSWYPHSFLAPPAQNEPALSSALSMLADLVSELESQGISRTKLYLLGFSQGACLTLEFAARHATRYGGIVAFTGGLIGDKVDSGKYAGDFAGTPVFIGTGDTDFHVPVERVRASTALLKSMGASVMEKVYPNRGHTISQDEIEQVNNFIFKNAKI
ncbi:alpha/beta hydrolase [Spirosoma spitsbergense]|uniref:alpha/beta hydrolase n=1 Tax=Spirosoma spitsbergense TaxID=431554 RepID=UPI00037FD981|nr:alpha/beta fold hydrolase [Spirosoma spitsbergense]